MSLARGTRLGPYEITGPLGAGGMGEVFRARDTRLGRDVAVKIMTARLSDSPSAAARFEREWQVVARLSHPNVLAVHDVGQHEGVTYAVTEFVPGDSLRQRLQAGPLSTRKAVEIAQQIAAGLAAAHQAGIVHRDLKPENVIITPDGIVKILDFGLARPHAEEPHDGSTALMDITDAGIVVGTRGYMSPEQARGEPADPRSDIFAFGTVLYEMLTGERAFTGASPVEVLHAVITGEPDAGKLSNTSPSLRRIVLRCLEKRREDRFSSARDLGYALEAAAESQSGGMAAAADDTPHRRPWPIPAIGLAAVALLGWWLVEARGPEPRPVAAAALLSQMTMPRGGIVDVAFSPDGRQLAAISYSGVEQGALWVRESGGPEWRRLASVNTRWDGAWCTWSPDGQSVVYPVVVEGRGRLQVVKVSTGVLRTLERDPFLDLQTAAHPADLVGWRAGAAWSRESGLLVGGSRLRSISLDTGEAHDVLDPSGWADGQLWPAFLPDGKSFVFTQAGGDPSKRGVYVGTLGSSRSVRLLESVTSARVTASGHLIYAENGALTVRHFDVAAGAASGEPRVLASDLPALFPGFTWFAVSADTLLFPRSGREAQLARLEVFDRQGNHLRNLGEPDAYSQVELSPDGRRLAIESGKAVFDVMDVAQGLRAPVGIALPGSTLSNPTWADDGTLLATRYTKDDRNLVSVDAVSGEVRAVLKSDRARWPQAVATTGEVVATQWEPKGSSLWAISLKASAAQRRLSHEGSYSIGTASLSHAGRWLAYDSDETGRFELYVQPFDGRGERMRVSPNGGLAPRWSPDGRELLYLDPEGTLFAFPATPSMSPGRSTALFKLLPRGMPGLRRYVALPDGAFVAIVPIQNEDAETSSGVLTNWTAALNQ